MVRGHCQFPELSPVEVMSCTGSGSPFPEVLWGPIAPPALQAQTPHSKCGHEDEVKLLAPSCLETGAPQNRCN